jgi:TetR/AcrR family fatty acid metabolism transcriptional regulator
METGDQVLEAARRCFGRQGYRKTSMDDVATEAGVAKGTVYLYCRNKQDLFVAAVERELDLWLDELSMPLDTERPATEVLIEMARRDAAFVEQRPLVADLLSGALDRQVPERRARLDALKTKGLAQVIAVLDLGVQQGLFDPELDVDATARVLQEMQLAGALLRHHSGRPLRQVRRQQQAALRLVLRGLERPDPRT